MTAAPLTTAHEWLRECDPWQCPVCRKDFCTLDDEGDPWEFLGPRQSDPDDIHQAAHCCLWKDHDHAARVRIAERVEAGENWADAIQGEGK